MRIDRYRERWPGQTRFWGCRFTRESVLRSILRVASERALLTEVQAARVRSMLKAEVSRRHAGKPVRPL